MTTNTNIENLLAAKLANPDKIWYIQKVAESGVFPFITCCQCKMILEVKDPGWSGVPTTHNWACWRTFEDHWKQAHPELNYEQFSESLRGNWIQTMWICEGNVGALFTRKRGCGAGLDVGIKYPVGYEGPWTRVGPTQ